MGHGRLDSILGSYQTHPPGHIGWRNRYHGTDFRAGIFKPLWRPGIDAKASIPPAYVAWRAGTITLFLLGA
jgi:hypothetical protein